MAKTDAEALKYAGGLGHTFAVVRGDSNRYVGFETDSLDSARRYAAEEAIDKLPVIYQRTGKKWKKVA